MAKKKPEQKPTTKYADVLTGSIVDVPEGQEPPATHPLKVEPGLIMCPAEALKGFEQHYAEANKPEPPEPPLRELPKGMNKFNSTNEFLMLILESLYRIERKMGA